VLCATTTLNNGVLCNNKLQILRVIFCQHHKLVHLGYVQKIKPQPVLAATIVLFLFFVQQLPQNLVLPTIFCLSRDNLLILRVPQFVIWLQLAGKHRVVILLWGFMG
jgi:hypothetical protein